MSGIFPIRRTVELDEDRGPRLVDLEDDVADEVFEALSSRTTRALFRELHASPRTASDLAAATDTSIQNATYHLEKLVDVDLVEVADTWYSERGTEMKVYAPTDESLVLFAGRDKRGTLRTLLERVAGFGGVLAPVSLGVWWLADRLVASQPAGGDAAAGGGDGGGVSIATEGARTAGDAAAATDPALVAGLAFFLGGLFVLSLVGTAWYRRNRSS